MKHLIGRVICLVVLLPVAAGAAGGAKGVPFKQSGSGFSGSLEEVDVNDDGVGGNASRYLSQGNLLGKSVGDSRHDILEWDGFSFCDFDPDGNPIAIEVGYAGISTIDRASNGDLLYRVMSSSPPTTICFNFVDSSFTLEIYTDVVGGTGKFDGATGSTVMHGRGRVVDPGLGLVGWEFESEGTIYLNDDDGDDDDDD